MKGARKAEEVNLFSQSIALPQVHSLFICNAFSLFLACRDYTAVGTNLTVSEPQTSFPGNTELKPLRPGINSTVVRVTCDAKS